jgi:hypothetical protein
MPTSEAGEERIAMHRNKYGQSRSIAGVTIGKLALITFVVLTAAYLFPAAQAKDKPPEETTQIYRHTYDEVFQASQDAIERMGMFVKDKDKDKGTISGNGTYRGTNNTGVHNVEMIFDIKIMTVSAKPETQVTVNAQGKGIIARSYQKQFTQNFLSEVQKVLATYH